MKVRVVCRPDKTVAVIYPAPKSRRGDETEEQWLERVFTKALQGELKGLPFKDIDAVELPQGRDSRDAWVWDELAGKITINPVKAEKIRREKLIREEMFRLEQEGKRQKAIDNLTARGINVW